MTPRSVRSSTASTSARWESAAVSVRATVTWPSPTSAHNTSTRTLGSAGRLVILSRPLAPLRWAEPLILSSPLAALRWARYLLVFGLGRRVAVAPLNRRPTRRGTMPSAPQILPTQIPQGTAPGVNYRLEGELVPVLHMALDGQVPISFEHHVLLWKYSNLQI